MKRIIFASFAILSIFTNMSFGQAAQPKRTSAAAVSAGQKNVEVPFVNKTLPNGLEVIVLPDASIPIVTVELDVRNGSFTEPPEFHGLSHLYEHMFFKPNAAVRVRECEKALTSFTGASNPGCADIMKLKPQIGDTSYLNQAEQISHYNGSTREEVVNYFYTTTSQYLAAAIRSINDSVRYPVFDPQEFDQEKQIVIGEIDRHESNPFQYLDQTMKEKLFYKYPTRKDPKGTRESVRSATIEKMKLIQSRYYVPNNAALIVTGDVKPEEVFKLAEQIMGNWQPRKVDPFKEFPLVEHPPLQKSEGIIIEKQIGGQDAAAGQNVFINIGWHGPSIGKDDAGTYAADVFSYIIQQPDSRFQRNLVDSGLAASVGFGYYTQRNVGPINLVVVTTADKAKQALAGVYKEVNAFANADYFTDEELESAKNILEASDLFDREKLSEYAHTLGFWWSSTGIEYFRGYHKNLRATSRQDIEKYLKTYVIGRPHIGIALMAPEARKTANITEQDLIGDK